MTHQGFTERWDGASDEELAQHVREGDDSAFGVLYSRHRATAIRVARRYGMHDEAEDAVSEVFQTVLQRLREGNGPETNVRGYLLLSVRREAARRSKLRAREAATSDDGVLDTTVNFGDGSPDVFEREAILRAMTTLPQRQRDVLWALDVEGRKTSEIADLWDMKPNTVSAMAYRARLALRGAYLSQHVSGTADLPERCRVHQRNLPKFVQDTLPGRRREQTRAHLEQCVRCRTLEAELRAVNDRVAAWLWVPAAAAAAPGTAVGAWTGKAGVIMATAGLGTGLGGLAASLLVATVPTVVPRAPVDSMPPSVEGRTQVLRPHLAPPAVRDEALVVADPSSPVGREASLLVKPVQFLPRLTSAKAQQPSSDLTSATAPSAAPPAIGDVRPDGYTVTAVTVDQDETTTTTSVPDQATLRAAGAADDVDWLFQVVKQTERTYTVTARPSDDPDRVLYNSCGDSYPDQRLERVTIIERVVTRFGSRTLPDESIHLFVDEIHQAPERTMSSSWASNGPPTVCQSPASVSAGTSDEKSVTDRRDDLTKRKDASTQQPTEPEADPEPRSDSSDDSDPSSGGNAVDDSTPQND